MGAKTGDSPDTGALTPETHDADGQKVQVDGKQSALTSKFSSAFNGVFRYFRLLVYAEPSKLDIALLVTGIITSIGAGIPFPILGILFGELVDNLNDATCAANDNTLRRRADIQTEITQKVILVVATALAQWALIYIYSVCWNLFGERLAHRLREKYFRSLLRQEVSFFDKLPAGEVSSRLSADINNIKNGTSEKVGVYLGVLALFVTSYIIAFIKGARLAGILVSLVPAAFIMTIGGGHYIGKYATCASEHIASASAIALESLSNVMVVHAFRANDRLEAKFAAKLKAAKSEGFKKSLAAAIQAGLLYFIAFAASGLAYWQGSLTIADVVGGRNQNVTVGSIYTIIFLLVDASIVISQVSQYLQIFSAASAALEKLKSDMDRRSKIDGTIEVPERLYQIAQGGVQLDNVTFTYPSRPNVPVIQNVSLDFPAGQTTAIVGLSGSGKSTVAGLLTRLYDPDAGRLILDGHDIQDINVRQLRSYIGLVQQDPMLLNRSVLENIALGLINSPRQEHSIFQPILLGTQLSQVASEVRAGKELLDAGEIHGPQTVELIRMIQHAADLADAGVFLDTLEFGLGTVVGPNGDLLSGGQKQRVALARALVKNPKILVLDEATSSLDSASEQRIQHGIEKASAGRTVISIAHRLATVKDAHKIVVMRNGSVTEQGSHIDLIAKDGEYAALVRLQNMGSETSSVSTAKGSKQLEIDMEGMSEKFINEEHPITNEKVKPETPDGISPGSQKTDAPVPATSVLKRMGSLTRPHLLYLFFAFFASLIVGGTYLGSALIFGNTIGALSPCHTEQAIRAAGSLFGILFFVLGIIEFFANGSSWSIFGLVAEKILYVLRVLSFRSLFEQDLQWHQSEDRTPASLLSFITSDTAAIGALTGSIIGTIFSIAVNFVGAIILAHIVAWKIAVVCLAIVPLMLGSGIMRLWIISSYDAKHGKAFEGSVGITVEAITSIKTVAALSLEQEILGNYHRSLSGPRTEMVRTILWSNVWLSLSMSLSNLLYALVYWWGSKQIVAGLYTQTQFFIVLISLLVSAQLWGQLFTLAPEITKAGQAVSRVCDLIGLGSSQSLQTVKKLSEDPEKTAGLAPQTPPSGPGLAVRFNQVRFSYPARPNRQVLKGLDLDVRPGQFCALVGSSGAGKSTIISLLERMYSIESGSIEVGGFNISAKKEPVFRDDIGLVPQDNVLFDGTIGFNVALGARPGVEPTTDEIVEACKLANLHETIMALPDGYDTQCGNSGGQLSGGQRQRLSIARALVRKPRLLLLDESTSALDAESERLLQDGLEKATRGITVVAIAHRLHTIRRADLIFMIEDGRCVEKGTHEELMVRSESYRVNVMHQTLDS
ncbi:P-loop containing nucleoside triphosphate hydrolase protein [Xylariaceae sp. FL1019]|nr:P-loop containing nucleoside triphosphate hydrolase protein [Xylariaceae sp. FL1019]